ncbi:MAG: SGNH/GDSL hydrolase family protein [Planctomycetota bacterium]
MPCHTSLLILSLLVPRGDEIPPTLLLGNKQKVVFLGDGITADGSKPGGYVWLVEKYLATAYPQLSLTFVNAGRRGDHVTGMARRLDQDVLAEKPKWIIVFTGLNDVFDGFDKANPEGNGPKGTDVKEFATNLKGIVSAGLKSGAQVALCTTTVLTETLDGIENELLTKYNDAIAKLAYDHKCVLVDINKEFHEALDIPGVRAANSNGRWLTQDGIRPNDRGSRMMAEVVLRALGMPAIDLDRVRETVKRKTERS